MCAQYSPYASAPPIGDRYGVGGPVAENLADRFDRVLDRRNFTTMGDQSLCSKVSLTVSAKNLQDTDLFSKSDPMCVVYLSSGLARGDGSFREVGRTEVVNNCINPEWSSKIAVDYYFEEVQKIRFEIYDIDSSSRNLKDHDFLGATETTLGEIVGAPYSRKTIGIKNERFVTGQRGELTVVAEESATGSHELVTFHCRAVQVDKKDFFGKSDPFLNIYRIEDDGRKHLVHRTEVVKNNLNPTWKPFEVPLQQLCAGDQQRKLIIECLDSDEDGGHDFIGCSEANVQRLLERADIEFHLINEKKKQKKGKKYVDSGRVVFDSVTVRRVYSFLEYIAGGTQLEFAVAVDMTASNGEPNHPESLHYMYGQEPNEYQIVIHAVADICQHYNNTKIFDAMGFGARLRGAPQPVVQHCFPLDLATQSYSVLGVPKLMEAYQNCINACELYGPTNFAPLIQNVAHKVAKFPKDGSRYQVLLIITDGCICDFEATKEAIVVASALPLSIIIIGVGGSDFGKMEELDSDSQLLMSRGKRAQRDIVQFVPLRNFLQQAGHSGNHVVSMALLAKEVLAEIPDQLTSYMSRNGIKPRPRDDPFTHPPPPEIYPNISGIYVPGSAPPGPPFGFTNIIPQIPPNPSQNVPGAPQNLPPVYPGQYAPPAGYPQQSGYPQAPYPNNTIPPDYSQQLPPAYGVPNNDGRPLPPPYAS